MNWARRVFAFKVSGLVSSEQVGDKPRRALHLAAWLS